MSSHLSRFHVTLGSKRTTVSLDQTLVELLAIKLGCLPETAQAHHAIRDWLQNELDVANDPGRYRVSQWLQSQALFEIADKSLYKRHAEWLLDG